MSVIAAVTAVVAAIGLGLWSFVLSPVPDDSTAAPITETTPSAVAAESPALSPESMPTTPTPTVTPTATQTPATPTPTPQPARFPPGAQPCPTDLPPVGGIRTSAAGNSATSCAFAEDVRFAYGSQPQRSTTVTVEAFSPVTDRSYAMVCTGDRLVTCTGGNNAVVYLI